MAVSRVLSRCPRNISTACQKTAIFTSRPQLQPQPRYYIFSNHFHSTVQFPKKLVGRHGICSSTSQPSENEQGSTSTTTEDNIPTDAKTSGDSMHLNHSEVFLDGEIPDRTKQLEEAEDDEISKDNLVKLVAEKEKILKDKHDEIKHIKDRFLRGFAEMENVNERTKREAEDSKKFAIQSFAKSLLDVADTLERASSIVKDSFSKIDASKDTAGAVPLLKNLLEGVQMTDKQLSEVFRKFGVEKYDPANEKFDPHRHNAVFQVPDGSKPAGIVASVMKAGYLLHGRVIRPAEVGVTKEVEVEIEGEEATHGSNSQSHDDIGMKIGRDGVGDCISISIPAPQNNPHPRIFRGGSKSGILCWRDYPHHPRTRSVSRRRFPGEEQVAGNLTKALSRVRFDDMRWRIGMQDGDAIKAMEAPTEEDGSQEDANEDHYVRDSAEMIQCSSNNDNCICNVKF